MLLRVQAPVGTRRIEVQPTDPTVTLFDKVYDVFGLQTYSFLLHKQRNKTQEIASSRSKTIQQLGLSHGDMIYATFPNGTEVESDEAMVENGSVTPSAPPVTSSEKPKVLVKSNVEEDEVDKILQKMDGKIQRKPDPRYCRHGENSSCLNCLPLEPYDETYLKEQNIKHVSFHAYLRKLSSGLDRGKFANLENVSCRIKPGCTGHPPWPRAVCSKCQPKAITLNRQVYRHVDNVMFENPHLVERFLHFWRMTGRQRLGYLYGRYEVHADVPLGIKAVVAAIYEPPQESSRDSISLLPDPREEVVEAVARKLGLRRVGWIFSDLIAEDAQKGTVRYFRHAETYFLSAQECIMAGHLQNAHPNPCSFTTDGYFGSKFTTICVTGDEKNHVHMEGYQVSNQCMALVRDSCLLPTKDAPELGFVKESSASQYVPDVYYKEKDNYGNEVTKLARPLPVEYLLVDLPVSTPLEPVYTFYVGQEQPFPVENRPIDGQLQDVTSLARYLQQFPAGRFLDAASDLHFLLYIATMDVYPLLDHMDPLFEAVLKKNAPMANEWAAGDHWSTVEQLLAHADHMMPGPSHSAGGVSSSQPWTCAHCTFINPPDLTSCEICTLPR